MSRLVKMALITTLIVAASVYAAGGVTYMYVSSGTGNASGSTDLSPNPTQGIPLQLQGQPVQGIMVTIADFRDGGANDFQQVGNGRLIALIGRPELKDPDGGQQWARFPAFDIEVDGGNPFIPSSGGAVTYYVPVNQRQQALGGPNARLIYFSQAVVGADGGVLAHKVLVEGRYSADSD